MGSRGPSPKSRQYLQLIGSHRASSRGDKPIAQGKPKCPTWLGPSAKRAWKRIVGELTRLGVVGSADADILTAYCQAVEELEHATTTLTQEGRFCRGPKGGLSAHPAVSQQRSAMRAIATLSNALGLNPLARQRLEVPPPEDETPDPFEQLLGDEDTICEFRPGTQASPPSSRGWRSDRI